MGPFEMMGQVDVHVDACQDILISIDLVQNRNGIPDILDADLLNLNFPVIVEVLYIDHSLSFEEA
jgi:hypothetical protein